MGVGRSVLVTALGCMVGLVALPVASSSATTGPMTMTATALMPTVAPGQLETFDVTISCPLGGPAPSSVVVNVAGRWVDTAQQPASGSASSCGQVAPIELLVSFAAPVTPQDGVYARVEIPGGSAYPADATFSVAAPSLALTLNTATPVAGDTVVASGTLRPCLNADAPVSIQQMRAGAWVQVSSGVVPGCLNGTSTYSSSFTAQTAGAVRAVVSAGSNSATSPELPLTPRTLVAPPGPIATSMAARLVQRRVHPGTRARVLGWIMPCSRGPVRLERQVGKRWRAVATETVACSGDRSPASFALRTRVTSLGTCRLRVVYDGLVSPLPRLRVVPKAQPVPTVTHVSLPPPPAAPPSTSPAPPPPI